MAEEGLDPTGLLIVVIGMVAMILLMIAVYASRYQRVPPNKVLLVFGRPRRETYNYFEDGKMMTGTRMSSYRAIRGGGTFVAPIIERAAWLSLESTTLDLKLQSIKTKDGRSVTVELTGQIKLRGDVDSIRAASELFLDKPHSEVVDAAREILEARARTVLAGMTLGEINADRKATETTLGEKIYEDLQRSGLALPVLVLKNIHLENDGDIILSSESIKPGDLFKVVKNASGDLIVQRVTTGVEG